MGYNTMVYSESEVMSVRCLGYLPAYNAAWHRFLAVGTAAHP